MNQKKTTREIIVIARYYVKKSGISNGVHYEAGSVVLLVENDKGVRYYTTIRTNGVHSCECPAKRTCYHVTTCAAIEAAREAAELKGVMDRVNARKVAAEKKLAAIALAKEVEAMVVEAEQELAREKVAPRELAPLNGNRSFSLLRR